MDVEHTDSDETEYVDIKAGDHSIYISETDTGVEINVRDHVNLNLSGHHKSEPRAVVDSVEFPTELEIQDTEDGFTNIIRRD